MNFWAFKPILMMDMKDFFNNVAAWSPRSKWKFVIFLSFLLFFLLIFIAFIFSSVKNDQNNRKKEIFGYNLLLDGKEVAWLPSKLMFKPFIHAYSEEAAWFENDRQFNELVQYKKEKKNLKGPFLDMLKEDIQDFFNENTACWSICRSNEAVSFLKDQNTAKQTLSDLIDYYNPPVKENESIEIIKNDFIQKPEICPAVARKDKILNKDSALQFLINGSLEKKIVRVRKGDSLWQLARQFNITVDDILKANPGVDYAALQPGQKLNLIAPQPFFEVVYEYKYQQKKWLPYQTRVKKVSTLYRTVRRIVKAGRGGEKEVLLRRKSINGIVLKEEILQEKILKQPETCIIHQGTLRTRDDLLLAQAIIQGSHGWISSYFGPRWGSFHYGVDIAVPLGTKVLAYDAGIISCAEYRRGYGKLVIVQHASGLKTYYAHNSAILVVKGQIVQKGQIISLSGDSGRTTGPHVHFETHQDGKIIDPLSILRKRS